MIERECDGSGTSLLCATKMPHSHCECGEPLILPEEYLINCCMNYCAKELAGISLHEPEAQIRTTHERTGDSGYSATGQLGHSPFKKRSQTYQHGDVLDGNRQEQNEATWAAKLRDEEPPF